MTPEEYITETNKLYTEEGFMKNNVDDPDISGNAWITQSVDFITRWDLGVISKDDVDSYLHNLETHNLGLGHWWRIGKIGDQQAHDDIIAITTVLLLMQLHESRDAGMWGRQHNWVYTYREDDWWWPIFGPTDYFRTAAFGKWWFSYLRMYIGVLTTSWKKPEATSGRQLDWLICRGLREIDRHNRQNNDGKHGAIIRCFIRTIMRTYPDAGMGDVFGIYYRNPEHPFSRIYNGKVYL